MKNTESINLLKGIFTPDKACEILLQLLTDKINFYNLKNWSSHERYGKPHTVSEEKLKYLREAEKNIEMFISQAVDEQKYNYKFNH